MTLRRRLDALEGSFKARAQASRTLTPEVLRLAVEDLTGLIALRPLTAEEQELLDGCTLLLADNKTRAM